MQVVSGRASIAVIAAVVIAAITACGPSTQDATSTLPPHESAPLPHAPSPPAVTTTHFGTLTLTHPATWHAYVTPHDDDLPNGYGAYLTDEPINPRCKQSPAGDATLLRCPTDTMFPPAPGPGQVWIEAELDYVARQRRPAGHLRIDGYPTRVTSSVGFDAGGFPTDRHGFPVPYCRVGTHHAVELTGTAPTTRIQPSAFVITACFGTHARRDRHAFDSMLGSATITTRPSQTAPVPNVPPCTRDDLRLAYSQQGVSVSILGSYQYTNVGRATCRVGGYPRLVLQTASGHLVGKVDVRHVGRVHTLYLRPTASVGATTQAYLDPDLRRRIHVTVERVWLPGVAKPFTHRFPRPGLVLYGDAPTIDVSPLEGD